MKKRIVIGFMIFLLCLFSSCEKELVIDCNALANNLYEEIDFEDELSEIEPEMAKKLYGIENATQICVYLSSGATAEEIAVIEMPNEDAAKTAQELVMKRISNQKASFERYIPQEVERLNHAMVQIKGKYVVFCVSMDENATEILQKHLE